MKRWLLALPVALILLVAGVALYGYLEARRDPVVRTAGIALPDWPRGAAPIRAVLLSDIHLGSPTMDDAWLGRIVAQVAALRPDIILIAGDFVSGHDAAPARKAAALLPPLLARWKPPLGVVAVLGNHDHWSDAAAVAAALRRSGVTLIDNAAIVRGPLRIAGIDDEFTGHDRPSVALGAASRMPGALVVLSHAPDVAGALPGGATLLAGHTHCGQILLPVIGPIDAVANRGKPPLYDPRYRCGIAHVDGRTVVVGAGLGTSVLPIRLGAVPDLWLLTLGPIATR